jgi:hypothetical protein
LRVSSTLSIIGVFLSRARVRDQLPYLVHHGINIITPRAQRIMARDFKRGHRMARALSSELHVQEPAGLEENRVG